MSDPTTHETPAELREYAERQKTAAETATAELEALRAENRQNALLAAGVDPESPVGAMFSKAYDGDLKVDAIKEEWLKVAPAPAPAAEPATTPATDDGPSPEEAAQAAQRAALTTGGQPAGQEPTPHPNVAAKAAFDKARSEGKSVESAQRDYLQVIMNAAAEGDERVLAQ